MEKNKDYKNTLLMPQTNFSMKANLVEKQKQYQEKCLRKRMQEESKKAAWNYLMLVSDQIRDYRQ